jgi:hypothetical protein
MQKFLRTSVLCLLLLGVANCASVGRDVDCNGEAIRLSDKAIDALSDDEVKAILTYNESGYNRGCYVPNR